MPLDVAAIEAEIAKLQKLREFAADPDFETLVARFARAEAKAPGEMSMAEPRTKDRPTEIRAEQGPAPPPTRGTLKQTVTHAALSEGDWFSGYDLTRKLREQGYPFAAKKPQIGILEILRGMVRDGLMEVQDGAGPSDPKLYRPRRPTA